MFYDQLKTENNNKNIYAIKSLYQWKIWATTQSVKSLNALIATHMTIFASVKQDASKCAKDYPIFNCPYKGRSRER